MKTRIPLINFIEKMSIIISFLAINLILITNYLIEGLTINKIFTLIISLAITIGIYLFFFRSMIKFDIKNMRIRAKGFRRRYGSIDLDISFYELKELIIDKKGKYSFILIFKSRHSNYDKSISMKFYRFTFFGKIEFDRTIKVIESWNEYLRCFHNK